MNLLNNPCNKECPDRHIGCHAECKRYQEAKRIHDEMRAEMHKDEPVRDYFAKSHVKKKDRYRKKYK